MKVYVAGRYLSDDGYPNARRTIQLLLRAPSVEVIECSSTLPEHFRLWGVFGRGMVRALPTLFGLFLSNLKHLLDVFRRTRSSPGVVYVPYPSVFLLWSASWIPRCFRPFFVADAYVLIWDTLTTDRALTRASSLFGHALRHVEARALRAAGLVLVDTEANRLRAIETLGIKPERVRSMPLAIDEAWPDFVSPPEALTTSRPLRILFFGTLVPLHGIAVVLEAFRRLSSHGKYELVIIGDGQQAALVETFRKSHPDVRFEWHREWHSSREIDQAVRSASICLGVFGGDGKASRVLPLKIYRYLQLGRPVVTQAHMSTPNGIPRPPVVTVDGGDGSELASAILQLISSRSNLQSYGKSGQDFYFRYLSNEQVLARWMALLAEQADKTPSSR